MFQSIFGSGIPILFLIVLGLFLGILLLRHPESPIAIFYPLLWLFWSYYIPVIGGRFERLIGLLAIAGVLFLLLLGRQKIPSLPLSTILGPAILILAYLTSSIINSAASPAAVIVSLSTRILFIYLAFFLFYKPSHLRLAANLFIITGLIGGAIILYWNYRWGLGFYRTYQGIAFARSSLGPFWFALIGGGNLLVFPAVLLIQRSAAASKAWIRPLFLLGAVFLFAMAFISQFRREILISASLVLVYVIITNLNNLRKPSIWVFACLILFYFFVLQPSSIFQARITETQMVAAGTDPRLLSLKAGFQAFLENPIIGSGPSSYETAAYRQMGPNYPSFYYHAYNVFIYFAVEAGAIGLIGLLLTLFGVMRQMTRYDADPMTPQGWILMSAPMIMIVMLVTFTFGNAVDLSLPWYFMGMILAAANLAMEEARAIQKAQTGIQKTSAFQKIHQTRNMNYWRIHVWNSRVFWLPRSAGE